MSIQVIHLIGVDTRVAQGTQHRPAWTVHIGRGHVTSIAAHAKTSQFRINFGATCLGVLVLFEHHHARAFAQYKTIAVFVPRA